jgi:hypothetical protein
MLATAGMGSQPYSFNYHVCQEGGRKNGDTKAETHRCIPCICEGIRTDRIGHGVLRHSYFARVIFHPGNR